VRALTEEIRVRLAAELDDLPVPARRDIDTAVAALLVAVARAVAASPVSKGTNRVLAGVIAFPLALRAPRGERRGIRLAATAHGRPSRAT